MGFSLYKWMVLKEEGRFREFDGKITYDPSNLGALSVEMSIAASSVDSRNESRDSALRSNDFFAAGAYPVLSFKSTHAEVRAADLLHVTGDLTIRDVTKQIVVPIRILGRHTVRSIGELSALSRRL